MALPSLMATIADLAETADPGSPEVAAEFANVSLAPVFLSIFCLYLFVNVVAEAHKFKSAWSVLGVLFGSVFAFSILGASATTFTNR